MTVNISILEKMTCLSKATHLEDKSGCEIKEPRVVVMHEGDRTSEGKNEEYWA